MKKLYIQIVVALCILTISASASELAYPPLPPGSIEIAYDDGDFNAYFTVSEEMQLRTRFTPPPETVGGLLKEARIAWAGYFEEADFFVRIKDAVTGAYIDSPPLTNAPGWQLGDVRWQLVDVSALGFVIPDNDFYIEVQHVTSENYKAVFLDSSSYSGRSEHHGLCSDWCPVGITGTDGEYGIRAVIELPQNVNYNFIGFSQPVDNPPIMNSAKAGQTIPLKWRLLDANNVPVTNLVSVTVTVASLTCSLGTTVDQTEEYAAGSSGLQNLGDGYYQFNWKTPTSYAKSCKTMNLNIGEGTTRTALFQFMK